MTIPADRPEDAVPSGRTHRAGLDGLRGIAALTVVVGHAMPEIGAGRLPQFFLAVDFFFVLSGYVIAQAYEARLAGGTLGFGRFLRQRVVRLHPMLLLSLAISLAFIVQHHLRGLPGPDMTKVAAAAVAGALCIPWHPLPAAVPGEPIALFGLNGPAWSLFVEYALNLAFALVVARLGMRALVGIVVAGALGLVGLVWWYGTMATGTLIGQGGLGLVRGVCPFFMGVLIHRLEVRGRLPDIALPWWIAAAVVAGVLVIPVEAPAPWLELSTILVVWPAVIVFSRFDRFGARMRTALLWGGALSYPVYILHVPIIHPIAHFAAFLSGPSKLLTLIAEVLLVALVAQIALRFYDAPVRQWLTRRLRGQR